MKKTALITGITGQDGAYLAELLLSKNYKVYGTYRRSSTPNFWRLMYLNIYEKLELIPADITDMASIYEAIFVSQPNEIYNLAAQSFVSASFQQPLLTGDVDGIGTTRILECIRQIDKSIKFYQASTSELYGNAHDPGAILNENSTMMPASPYAAAKIYSLHQVKVYREAYGMFVSNGILFNHESPIRGLEFVTRKVTNLVAKIKVGIADKLVLGNLDSIRDWGYAREYVEGMWRILQSDKPDDYVIATGEAQSVKTLVKTAFDRVGLDWEKYTVTDRKFLRPIDVGHLLGDTTKISNNLNWEPQTKFKELIENMVDEDLNRWEKCSSGELFPWDAPNYPGEHNLITRYKKS